LVFFFSLAMISEVRRDAGSIRMAHAGGLFSNALVYDEKVVRGSI
jgi:hypothetical protein